MPTTTSNMKPAEFEAFRLGLGMSQIRLAEALGVDSRTIRRWELGEFDIPIILAALVRLAKQHNISPEQIYEIGTGEVLA